jgi:hypothetical protein
MAINDSRRYDTPEILVLGEVAALTRGSGDIYPDSLGTAGTHYGKVGMDSASAAAMDHLLD